jgi:hypothetical protein
VEHLGRRVRVEDVEISDRERNYGRSYAGRVGEIQQVSREPSPPGVMAPGGISGYTVRLDDGTLINVRPEEVRFL